MNKKTCEKCNKGQLNYTGINIQNQYKHECNYCHVFSLESQIFTVHDECQYCHDLLVKTTDENIMVCRNCCEPHEVSTRPEYYGGQGNPMEVIKIIQHYELSFELGNVLKYIVRKKENRLQDLKKALVYLRFEIEKYEKTIHSSQK